MAITHTKVSAKSDGGDAALVRPSDWNADHSGVSAITTVDAALGADVSLTAATTTDLVSVSLAAGTWDLWGYFQATGAATANYYATISDNSNTQKAYALHGNPTNGAVYVMVPVFLGSLVVASTATYKLRGACDSNATAKGTTSLGTGGGTKLHAMKIA